MHLISNRSRAARLTGLLAVGLAVLAPACGGGSSTTKVTSSTSTSTVKRSSTSTTAESPPSTKSGRADAVLAPPLLALFPFQTVAEVQAWQQEYRADGQPAQYLDPGATAVAFAQFLGYAEIDQVVGTRVDAKGAHVSVGAFVPDTDLLTTAAIVHLVRFGTESDAPWEVVGTDDTTFSVTRPRYGSTITSPLPVGGEITGVDENIKIRVLQLHAISVLGEFCCVPAGSEPWSATVTFSVPTDPVLIVSASTGGHIRAVERFSVNGVKAG